MNGDFKALGISLIAIVGVIAAYAAFGL